MLDPFSRGAMIAMSVVCISAAVALAPLRARSSHELNFERRVAAVSGPLSMTTVANIDVRRDPFAAEPSPQPSSLNPAPVVNTGTAPLPLPAADTLGPLPSNLSSSTIPALPGDMTATSTGPRVTAIITGLHPYAMLDTAGNHEIKGIGDPVHGTPIVAIDIDGITLRGGERLLVTPGELSR